MPEWAQPESEWERTESAIEDILAATIRPIARSESRRNLVTRLLLILL
jgi:hypothetical protein